jgi:protein phosphatase PTC7
MLMSKFSTLPAALQRSINPNPHFISVVCGFPKDLRTKYKIGKFGDDAWFTSSSASADVIGK